MLQAFSFLPIILSPQFDQKPSFSLMFKAGMFTGSIFIYHNVFKSPVSKVSANCNWVVKWYSQQKQKQQFRCFSLVLFNPTAGRKHCGKRRKCCLPAFSPFPTMFSKATFLITIKLPLVRYKGTFKKHSLAAFPPYSVDNASQFSELFDSKIRNYFKIQIILYNSL